MRLRTALWVSFSWLVLPLGTALSFRYAASALPATDGYPLASQTSTFGAAVLVLPLVCAASAVVGSRFTRALASRGPGARSVPRVVAGLVGPTAAAGWLALCVVTLVIERGAGLGTGLDPALAAAYAVAAAAYAALGFAAGGWVRPAVALPLALALPYLVMAFPPAMEPLWLRHLTTVSASCCEVSDVLSTRAVWGMALFGGGMLGAGLAATALRLGRRGRSTLVTALLGASAAGTALALVVGLGVAPSSPRPGAPRCTLAGATRMCLWPEHEAARARAERLTERAAAVADRAAAPLSVPHTLTEQRFGRPAPGMSTVALVPAADDPTMAAEIVRGLVGASPECTQPRPGPLDHQMGVEVVSAWWLRRARLPAPGPADPDAARLLIALERLDPATQAAYVAAAMRAIGACAGPPAVPAVSGDPAP